LANFLDAKLHQIAPHGGTYAEPYAGGAGAAVKLLASGAATEIFLNDRDPRIYCAWQAILYENDRFRDRLLSVVPDIDQWWACKKIVEEPATAPDRFELGFATFFLNRTNRSGILQGAAPIGGYEQEGDWKLDARFYRETLLKRVEWLGKHKDRISVSRLDGLEFVQRMARRAGADQTLNFIDPPYVAAGSRLYLNAMRETDHRSLAEYLSSGALRHWIVTYDDCNYVRQLYRTAVVSTLKVRYTLQRRRSDTEVLITPRTLALPAPSND
jgi:DNA adenine methylase